MNRVVVDGSGRHGYETDGSGSVESTRPSCGVSESMVSTAAPGATPGLGLTSRLVYQRRNMSNTVFIYIRITHIRDITNNQLVVYLEL